jgi:hypothetical protein
MGKNRYLHIEDWALGQQGWRVIDLSTRRSARIAQIAQSSIFLDRDIFSKSRWKRLLLVLPRLWGRRLVRVIKAAWQYLLQTCKKG